MPLRSLAFTVPLALQVLLVSALSADNLRPRKFDWPQWQGRDRTAVSRETGLLKEWPSQGPPLAWSIDTLGGGYSTPSIAAGRVFGMSYRGEDEVVWALEEATGKELWSVRIARANRNVDGPLDGSRCTPTVDGDRLFVLGLSADLVCLKTTNGEEVWRKNLRTDFGGKVGGWGYSESPLIDGDKLLCTPGGKQATLLALDKKTGETIWTAPVPGGDEAAYSSIVAADVDGQREYIQFLSGGVVGISAVDGKFLWRYTRPSAGINCSTPVYYDQRVYAAAAYGKGGGLVELTREGGKVKAEEVYFHKNAENHHGGLVLVNGYLYGEGSGKLVCRDFKTGKEMWRANEPGKGSIAAADGRLYYRNERGPIFLVEADSQRPTIRGRFELPKTSGMSSWPHPVVANGKLYLRDQEYLYCYDVKRK